MSKWLSPTDIQNFYSLKRTITYRLIKEYAESGGEVIKIGSMKRVPEEQFTNFLLNRGKHENS
jgi:hypothetical protein